MATSTNLGVEVIGPVARELDSGIDEVDRLFVESHIDILPSISESIVDKVCWSVEIEDKLLEILEVINDRSTRERLVTMAHSALIITL